MTYQRLSLRVIVFIVFLNLSLLYFHGIYMPYSDKFFAFSNIVFTVRIFLINALLSHLIFLLFGRTRFLFRTVFYLLCIFNAITILYFIDYSIFLNYSTIILGLNNAKKPGNGSYLGTSLLVEIVLIGLIVPLLFDFFFLKSKLKTAENNIICLRFKSLIKTVILYSFFYCAGTCHLSFLYKKDYVGANLSEMSFRYLLFPTNILSCIEEWYSSSNNSLRNKYEKLTQLENYSLNKKFKTKSQTIIFTFGESLDASHLKANGYKRETTPFLDKQKNIVFLKKLKSCATNTGTAHPCMIKPFVTKDYWNTQNILPLVFDENIHSLVSIFKKNGFKAFYVGHPNNEKSLKLIRSEFNPENVQVVNENEDKEEFLKAFQNTLKDRFPKKIIFILTKGEHTPYKQAKGFEKFPVKDNINTAGDLKGRLKDKKYLYNRYDNAILYSEKVMSQVIDLVKKSDQNSILYFFSDHGENLDNPQFGTHGMDYLRAPYDVTHPAAFLWVSNKWLKNINPNTLNLFKRYKNKEFSYDDIFHSVLDCSGIESKYINRRKSLCYTGQ